jgi:U4/U6 small nuclear ribonucleoprotein PRP3
MEWWDELFLPKNIRDDRKKSVAASGADNYEHTAIINVKTHKFIQHPVCIKAIGGEKQITVVPMFLTKKEKRKIRKSKRAAAEREKLDKIMMGLLPTPEPKFKLSNFMKILGDQAVVDPSKVELKVLEQIKQRQIEHEVRNEAAKLTPIERAKKQTKKLTEDTSRQVHVALFKIKDFSNTKNSWKVDINAQQYQLSGLVLLCDEKNVPTVVIVEGGPKAIRKFTKLMLKRIKWNAVNDEMEAEDNESSDEDGDKDVSGGNGNSSEVVGNNFCHLLWNGVVAKRTFTGFKFQECKSKIAVRKVLEAKNVPHYWDIVLSSKEFDDL